MESARGKTERLVGAGVSWRGRQSLWDDGTRAAVAATRLQRGDDGLTSAWRERRRDGKLRLARTQRHQRGDRRIGTHGTSATSFRAGKFDGRGNCAASSGRGRANRGSGGGGAIREFTGGGVLLRGL